jgi:xanthine/CO dehydrogenase XdhC/CoxF family maturation factor
VSILAELIAVKHGKVHAASMAWTPPSLKSQVSTLKSQ